MRLLIVQYAGDYREAYYNLAAGRGETYYAQQYSVDAVSKLRDYAEEVATLCFITEQRYEEVLPNGVRAIGMGFSQKLNTQVILDALQAQRPTHIVLRTPNREVLRWANKNNVKTLMTLADSFSTQGIRNFIKNRVMSGLLNHPQVQWVGNHGIGSSESLQQIGVNPNKIIPWDFPPVVTPDLFSAKTLRPLISPLNLMYVGMICESKGVGDVLEAIAALKRQGIAAHLKLAGKGNIENFLNQAQTLGIRDSVEYLGLVKNTEIVNLMNDADFVVVPSHHDYPEGFPFTIYEGLSSRTPIVASDHPMFLRQLQHGSNAMIFPAGNSAALAQCIAQCLANPALYASISEATHATWKKLQIPVKWAEMIDRWVQNMPQDQDWLFQHRLASGRYGAAIATEQPQLQEVALVKG
jgi:glycosyltransferase involved in cell wall biosynthesis